MAAIGKTPILLYGSTTATNVPVAGNLTNSSDGCEIAINVADKNLFFKDSTNAVNTVPIRQSSASSNGWLSSTDWNTFNNKASTTSPTFLGDVTLSTGNVVISTLGKGIDFSATAGTGTSELLADYEEGTWTPVYTPTTGSFTSITASNTGWYRKIGSLVVAGFSIKTTAATTIGTASGTLKITGLPYTVYTDASGSGSAAVFQQWNLGTAFTNIGVTADGNSTFLYFSKNSSNSNVAYVQATELNTAAGSFNNLMQGFIIYKTTV